MFYFAQLGKSIGSPTLSETADPIDVAVGNRVRMRRAEVGVSAGDLALALGVSQQQVNKYERGLNRISAGRLACIAKCLQVAPEYFFQIDTDPRLSLHFIVDAIAPNGSARTLAQCASIGVGMAALNQAALERPGARLLLRRGADIIDGRGGNGDER